MDAEDKVRQMGRLQRADRAEGEEQYKRDSLQRLIRNAETKINTTMIGSLSAIEQVFGHLWGQGKPRGTLTDREREMEALKDELRTLILNNGNNQKRAMVAEINQYEVEWKRYRYELNTVGDDDTGKVFGLKEDGSPKGLRYGKNEDGSIRTQGGDDRPTRRMEL